MKMKVFLVLPLAAAAVSAPAMAQLGQVNEPAPGYSSLLSADYGNAEREIRGADVSKYDPARSINLGIALAKQGHPDQAARQFNHVLMEEDVEMVLANGETAMSHAVAQRALGALQNGVLSQ